MTGLPKTTCFNVDFCCSSTISIYFGKRSRDKVCVIEYLLVSHLSIELGPVLVTSTPRSDQLCVMLILQSPTCLCVCVCLCARECDGEMVSSKIHHWQIAFGTSKPVNWRHIRRQVHWLVEPPSGLIPQYREGFVVYLELRLGLGLGLAAKITIDKSHLARPAPFLTHMPDHTVIGCKLSGWWQWHSRLSAPRVPGTGTSSGLQRMGTGKCLNRQYEALSP